MGQNLDKNKKFEQALKEFIDCGNLGVKKIAKKYRLQSYAFSLYIKSQGVEIPDRIKKSKEKFKLATKEFSSGNFSACSLAKKYKIHGYEFLKHLKNCGFETKRKRKYNYDENYFDKINTEEKAYWLGFIVADGHVKQNVVRILLSDKDTSHLEKFAKIFGVPIKKASSYNHITQKTYKNVSATLCSKKMSNDLKNKGLSNNKTFDLDDTIFSFIPNNLIHHFIRGFFDGDGCISNSYKNEYQIMMIGTKSFLLKVRKYLIDFAGVNSRKLRKDNKMYRLEFGGNSQVLAIKSYLYNNSSVFLERKKAKFDLVVFGRKTKGSQYRGVSYIKRGTKRWIAVIYFKEKNHHLGFFMNEIDAARAYDAAIDKYKLPKYKKNLPESERKIVKHRIKEK